MSNAEHSVVASNDWTHKLLGEVYAVPSRSGLYKKADCYGSGNPMVHMPQMFRGFTVDSTDAVRVRVGPLELSRFGLESGDLLFARRSLTLEGAGQCSLVPQLKEPTTFESSIIRVRLKTEEVLPIFLNFQLSGEQGLRRRLRFIRQVAVSGVSSTDIASIPISFPSLSEQRTIARILTTLDNVIEKTEGLIAKYQAIKQGMMHDLFNRGIDSSGSLRPTQQQAPDLYKQSELGWIPKEWDVKAIGDFVESLIDGPFGSNLKTEHYVTEPAVRVVRLQNITDSGYDDTDPAFISQSHAKFLSRHKVVGGDVLIASLGDDNHPPGRSCLYPSNLPPAVNKADCFRLRCNNETAVNAFVSYSLNASFVRKETKRFTQGVTLVRINGSNMKKVRIRLPLVDEQRKIVERLRAIESTIEKQQILEQKYRLQKSGLMQDLLTGKVRVIADEEKEVLP
jgi:restriction endonuclease S subunit